MSSKKPHERLTVNGGQKGVRECLECGKFFFPDFEKAKRQKFCSPECEDHYEANQKPDIDNSILNSSKDVIMESNSDKDDNEGHHHL